MQNPLLDNFLLPPFSAIKAEHIEPAMDHLLAEGRQKTGSLLANNEVYSWANLIQPMEEMDDKLSRAWSPVSHLNAVMNNELWRDAYSNCLPKLRKKSRGQPA